MHFATTQKDDTQSPILGEAKSCAPAVKEIGSSDGSCLGPSKQSLPGDVPSLSPESVDGARGTEGNERKGRKGRKEGKKEIEEKAGRRW